MAKAQKQTATIKETTPADVSAANTGAMANEKQVAQAGVMKTVKSAFNRSSVADRDILAVVPLVIDHMFTHNDWTPLAWSIKQARDTGHPRFPRLIGVCVGGVTLKRDAKQPSGYRVVKGDNAAPTEVLATVRELVAAKHGLKSKEVGKLVATDPAAFDLTKVAQNAYKRITKGGASLDAFIRELRAAKKADDVVN